MTARKGYVLTGRVVDGTLNKPLEQGAVVTEGERIVWVGAERALPAQYRTENYESLSLPDRTVMPGLVDGHVHISFGEARSEEELALYTPVEYRALKAAWNARKILRAGVTSAFDAATTYNVAQAVRDAIEAGMYEGPRFAVSGKQLTSHQGLEDSFPNSMEFPPGQAGVLIKTKDDLVEQVRYQVKDGVDAIKVSGSNDSLITPDSLDGSAFTFEEFKIIADESHRHGKLCTVHARSRDSIVAAAKAGFDVIFHASYIDEEGIEWCLKNKAVIIPTLPLLVNIVEAQQDMAGVSGSGAFQREIDAAISNLPKAHKAGIPFIQGSESGWSPVPYGEWHMREAEIFVTHLGFSPQEAIHSATLGATRLFKRFGNQIGKLEAGRYADVVVVKGDPTRDITLLQKPALFDLILKGGKPVDRSAVEPRKQWYYERHKIFLDGVYHYDPASGKGVLER
jgi:imidazolonepropionase-like amidohydrolase